MKKILFILHYPPPVHGASMMGQFIKQSKLVNGSFVSRYINLGTSTKVDEIGAGGVSKWVRTFKIAIKILAQLIRFRPNLVYFTLTATGSGFFKDASQVLLAKLFGKRLVYHMHNKGVSLHQNHWFYNICYRFVFKNAKVILLSQHLFGDIEKYVEIYNVYVCPNGVPDDSSMHPRKNKQRVQLLFLSNLIESKGVYDLLDACAVLKGEGLDFTCHIIGGEGDITGERLERVLQEKELHTHVDYLGKRYGAEKAKAYSEADIFIFPTYYPNECFPLVLLEAMQYKLPIISSFEGGIPDIVVDGVTGYLVHGRDVKTIAESTKILINDSQKAKAMGQKGRHRYEEKFTLAAFEAKLTRILKELTESKIEQ